KVAHALYALSFLIYSTNTACDWLHVYCVLRGYVTSFTLKTWFAVYLTCAVVAGTMLNGLLMVLCMENAFASGFRVAPYRTGLAVIYEAVVEWLQSFNNFRVAFLVLALHDGPMTVANFFFIAACRCSGPELWHWSLLLSTGSTTISLFWRLVMLYFAYRRLICPPKMTGSRLPSRQPSFREHFEASISLNDGGRLDQYDETWPIRWSIAKVYGHYPDQSKKTVYLNGGQETDGCATYVCGVAASFVIIKVRDNPTNKMILLSVVHRWPSMITQQCFPVSNG
ncbi:Protein K04E7.1, partial [Aphelenchoides avenae]